MALALSQASDGPTLADVLDVLQQVIAALMHLHSPGVGILHRDVRAANILIDSLHPVKVRLADFGVSHLLSVRARGEAASGQVPSVITGDAALAPVQV